MTLAGSFKKRGSFKQIIKLLYEINGTNNNFPSDCTSLKMQYEIIHLLAEEILDRYMSKIKSSIYLSIIANEAIGMSNKVIPTLSHQTVNDEFEVSKTFIDLWAAPNIKSDTLECKVLVSCDCTFTLCSF